jgi:hypothetical protein
MRFIVFVALFGLIELAGTGSGQDLSPSAANQATSLMNRVTSPSQQAVDVFVTAGMKEVKAHFLTEIERSKVERALASLPELNRRVLQGHLHTLGFVDGIPGNGTGLTSPSDKPGPYDITLRASIIDESLTTFLTTKERRIFVPDQSRMSVTVRATGTDALTYVLLHESTHVVDSALQITASPARPFADGIWASHNDLVPGLRESLATKTVFRGQSPIPMSEAIAVYNALTRSPFVSLYATASASEDFAELVAWHEILRQHDGDLVIEIDDAHGRALRCYKPLWHPEVTQRFSAVDRLLASE